MSYENNIEVSIEKWIGEVPEEQIGIFIEECKLNEELEPLTFKEMNECVVPIHNKIEKSNGWSAMGFEAGRALNKISYKCDSKDFTNLCDWRNWELEEWMDDDDKRIFGYRKWAVEFPVYQPKFHFVRRYFYFRSKYHVPVMLSNEEFKDNAKKDKISKRTKRGEYGNVSML